MNSCGCGCGGQTRYGFVRGHHSRVRIFTYKKHGMTNSPEYYSWLNMKQRVNNPNDPRFHDYGGRGIKLCERWVKFEKFLADMGKRPNGTTLDRFPDKDGDYKPGNCRWATPKQQQNNTRANVTLKWRGITKSIGDWAEEIGISHSAISTRVHRNWSVKRIFTQPIQKRRK